MASDVGAVTAIDAAPAERIWQQRVEGIFSASPVAGDGKIYFVSETGETIVLKAGRSRKFSHATTRRAADRIAGDLERSAVHPHRRSCLRDRFAARGPGSSSCRVTDWIEQGHLHRGTAR